MNLAYFFEDETQMKMKQSPIFTIGFGKPIRPGLEATREAVKEWVRFTLYDDRDIPILQIVRREPTLRIVDTRPIATATFHELDEVQSRIYLACDSAQELRALREKILAGGVSEAQYEDAVAALIESKLLLKTEGRLLALAFDFVPLPLPPIADAPTGFMNDYHIAGSPQAMEASSGR